MWAAVTSPYNGAMTFTDPSLAPQLSVADVFFGHLVAGDFDQLALLFEPNISLSALLPEGLREWQGPEGVTAAFTMWFGAADDYELLDAAAGQAGPRLHLRWRARVRGGPFGESSYVVEQHVYADRGPSGRIEAMSMLCSGFAREHRDG
jgi:hypothetical protein